MAFRVFVDYILVLKTLISRAAAADNLAETAGARCSTALRERRAYRYQTGHARAVQAHEAISVGYRRPRHCCMSHS